MLLFENSVEIPLPSWGGDPLTDLDVAIRERIGDGSVPIRCAVTDASASVLRVDVGSISCNAALPARPRSIFAHSVRPRSGGAFNIAFVVPTGVGSEIGGHAGDAGPAARLLGGMCDTLITHPNVVNASDINEMPLNGLYVEGSILSRFLLGTVGLRRVRSNRVLVVIDEHADEFFTDSAINSVNGARASYGLDCPRVVTMRPPVKLRARFAPSGRAAGRVEGLAPLLDILTELRDEYDAVSISSVIDVPHEFHTEYFEKHGEMINPWGGVEAMLTHTISTLLDVPSAHSPMFESQEISNLYVGVVDPRMAAEAVSVTFLQCTLKGLSTAPRVVTDPADFGRDGTLDAGDVSCLVIPDGCLGLPTLAALLQGIPVIAVEECQTIMKNDLGALPWRPGQFRRVANFWEAAGIVATMKAGISPESVRRPIAGVAIDRRIDDASSIVKCNRTGETTCGLDAG